MFLEAFCEMRRNACPAVCESSGRVLRFYSPVIAIMPMHHVKALIAHELAHVLQASRGQPIRTEATDEQIAVFGTELAADIAYAGSESNGKRTR